ncbi:hypothetical protein SDC9_67345 [bioreactor metagenome]|uniref:Uncharacterized protein n=1 Tax=bioreactor metagenome TaxID=1076179 RepID=A0A644XYD0_9ZZZZ
MFKLWIDRTGAVQSFSMGSLEEQHKDLVNVLKHLQERVSESERIVDSANAAYIKALTKKDKEHSAAVRREASEMGILQNRKENKK